MSLFAVIITPIIVYTLYLLIHWIPFKLMVVDARVRMLTIVLLCCLPLVYPVYQYLVQNFTFPPAVQSYLFRIFLIGTFTLLWCGYVQFVFAFDGSPSLQFLIEILNSPTRRLTSLELHGRFNFTNVYRHRFFRAVTGGALIEFPGKPEPTFRNGKTATRFAVFGAGFKRFFNLGAGG